jgi:hypothetical protein
MTNILYLNDSTEFTYTLKLIKSEAVSRKIRIADSHPKRAIPIPPLIGDERKNASYSMIIRTIEEVETERFLNLYVFSLSEKANDLNQWRGYCPRSGGYCIVFNTSKLKSSLAHSGKEYDFKLCIYNEEEQISIIKSLFDNLDQEIDKNPDSDYLKILSQHLAIMSSQAPFIKHDSFQNEHEWRIVTHQDETIMFRAGISTITPYCELNILDDNNSVPITKIIIGPTPHKELARNSVKILLEKNHLDYVDVEFSNHPYRTW